MTRTQRGRNATLTQCNTDTHAREAYHPSLDKTKTRPHPRSPYAALRLLFRFAARFALLLTYVSTKKSMNRKR